MLALEDNLKYQVKLLNDKMTGITERADRDHDTFEILTNQCSEVMGELSQLKETYKKQCDIFVYEVNRCNKMINDHAHHLTTHCQRLDKITDTHSEKLDMNASKIAELLGRMAIAEKESRTQ